MDNTNPFLDGSSARHHRHERSVNPFYDTLCRSRDEQDSKRHSNMRHSSPVLKHTIISDHDERSWASHSSPPLAAPASDLSRIPKKQKTDLGHETHTLVKPVMNATDAPNTKHSASEAIAATALIQIATLPPPQCAQRPLTPRSSGDVSPRRSASQAISPNHHLRSSPNHNQSQVPDPFHTPTRKRQQNPMLMLTPVSPGHVRQVSSQASEPPSRPHHETHHTHQAPAALSVSPQPTSADPGSLVSPSIRHEGLGMPLPLPRPMREPFQRESFKFVNESISPKFSPDKNANPTSQRGPASRALQNIVFHSHHHDSKPKRHRLNKFQLDVLNMVFERAFYPSAATREALAAKLDMEPKAVQVWFQNQRQNWRGKVQKTQDPSQKDQDLVSSEASAPSSDAPVPARPRGKRQSAKNTLKREDAHEGKDVDLDEIFAQLSRPQGDQPVDISVPRTPSPRPQPLS